MSYVPPGDERSAVRLVFVHVSDRLPAQGNRNAARASLEPFRLLVPSLSCQFKSFFHQKVTSQKRRAFHFRTDRRAETPSMPPTSQRSFPSVPEGCCSRRRNPAQNGFFVQTSVLLVRLEPVLVKKSFSQFRGWGYKDSLFSTRRWSLIFDKTGFFWSGFPMFVPSLSW